MTNREARHLAQSLGMSVWRKRVRDDESEASQRVKCVGFASVNIPFACAECWEEALERAAGLVFSM